MSNYELSPSDPPEYRDTKHGLRASIHEIMDHVVTMHPSSREDMKAQLSELLHSDSTELIDTHNTKSMIFVFDSRGERFGLKIEYGEVEHGGAKVTRDEAHWYEKVPDRLKKHYVGSALEDTHAFVVLRWYDGAPTIEELAQAPLAGEMPAIEAYLDALRQDEELFASYEDEKVALPLEAQHNFFREKFYTKLKQAETAPYLHDLLTQRTLVINGVEHSGPIPMIERVSGDARLREYLLPHRAGFIHGDLHADNLIVDSGNVYMVDPNGLDHLPIEYDHGRVLWSLSGWNAIVRHEHTLRENVDGSYELDVPIRAQYSAGKDEILRYFREFSLRQGLQPDQAYHRALYSSAVQYLSRADHAAVRDEAIALHLRGVQQMSELFDILGIEA